MGYYDLYIRKSGGVELNLQEKTIIPLSIGNIITPDEPYNGLSKVTILSEPDLIPANIKIGKNIYGIEGTYDGTLNKQPLTIDITGTTSRTIPIDGGIQITGITINSITGITPDVIKNNVNVLGVTGNYVAAIDVRPLTFDPIYNGKTLVPSGYDGYSSIVQNPIANLNELNVKKGVTIAGITGKYAKHEWYDNLTIIPDYFFKNNTNIIGWETPQQCLEIGVQAIYNCELLKKIVINLENDGCKLGDECFANNPNLRKISFNNPNFVSDNYNYLINNPNLLNIVVPVGWNTNIDLTGCDSILKDSLEELINNLKDLSGDDPKYIITGTTNYAKIRPDLFDLAKALNWEIFEKSYLKRF